MSFNDGQTLCTTSGEPVEKVRAEQTEKTGQHKAYIVLCEDERKKGFVRPYRDNYRHTGPRRSASAQGEMCGAVTRMGHALSETYARDPSFYGATYCCACEMHIPIAEFVWTADGQQVGT